MYVGEQIKETDITEGDLQVFVDEYNKRLIQNILKEKQQ